MISLTWLRSMIPSCLWLCSITLQITIVMVNNEGKKFDVVSRIVVSSHQIHRRRRTIRTVLHSRVSSPWHIVFLRQMPRSEHVVRFYVCTHLNTNYQARILWREIDGFISNLINSIESIRILSLFRSKILSWNLMIRIDISKFKY